MNRSVVSRSQRRLEKKQALILLALVLAVALASFALGVMVGRSSARPAPAATPSQAPVRLPVAPPGPETSAAGAAAANGEAGGLTFYDQLPRGGKAPLGSGINLPPRGEAASAPVSALATQAEVVAQAPSPTSAASPAPVKPAAPAAKAEATAKAQPPVKEAAPAPKSSSAPAMATTLAATPPPTAAGGAFVVQAAAFREAADAGSLRERLARKGYAAYTQEANLGEKGVWHRVYVGPFATAAEAEAAAGRLQAEEKLSVMVRRR